MKDVACYKKSASSANVWLFNVYRIVTLLSRSIAIFFMQLMKIVILLTYLLISLSLSMIVLADRLIFWGG